MLIEVLTGGAVLCVAWGMLRCSRHRADATARLHAVTLSSIGDAVIATDLAGAITFINAESERLTGWLRADAIGSPIEAVFQIVNHEVRCGSR